MTEKTGSENMDERNDFLRRQYEETASDLLRSDVRNLDLTRRLQQTRRSFQFISVLSRNIEQAFEENDLFDNIVRALTSDLNLDAAALFRAVRAQGRLDLLAQRGLELQRCDIDIPQEILNSGDVERVWQVNGRTAPGAFQRWLVRRFGMPCLTWHPAGDYGDGKLILYIGNRYEDMIAKPPFNEDILEALGAICAVIGLKLDNIRKTGDMLRHESERRSIERYRELAEALPQPVLEADTEGRLIFLNSRGFQEFGYTREEMTSGLSLFQLTAPDYWERMWMDVTRVLKGINISGLEYMAARADGSLFPVLMHAAPIYSGERVTGVRGIMIDLTERRQLEEQRIRTEKLESVGLLAGGIAHDFNNILMAMLGSISMVKRSLEDRPEHHEMLTEAEHAGYRARELTQQLLTFSRGGAPVLRPAYIPQIIRETARFSLMGSKVSCRFSIADNLWSAEVDTGQISQVINNLVLNAVQAMPEGGEVKIRAGNVEITSRSHLPLRKGCYIKIVVEDTGCGIPEENLSRIFDPYFTTKENGSGLGLATSYSIITRHGGCITVQSTRGHGSIFAIYLPALDMVLDGDKAGCDVSENRHKKVLLMDDEEVVQRVVARMLNSLGHEVLVVKDGETALDEYRQANRQRAPFDVVILDLTIQNGMGGRETAERLLEEDPKAMVILSSGYTNDPVLTNYRDYGCMGVITKPYLIEELREALESL